MCGEEALSGTEAVAFAWAVLLGFVRISTNAAIFERPALPTDSYAIASADQAPANPVSIEIACS